MPAKALSYAIIPARGGSKRIPRKNIKEFNGIQVIAYPIKTAQKSGLFDKIFVSTEDPGIASIAAKYGAEVMPRSALNANDYATTSDVLKEVVEQWKELNLLPARACCIYPVTPLLQIKFLEEGYKKLLTGKYHSVFPVVKFPSSIFRALTADENGYIKFIFPENQNKRTQDLPEAYYDVGQFYWFDVEKFIQAGQLITSESGFIVLPEYFIQDVDNPADWQMLEWKYRILSSNGMIEKLF